MSTEIVFAEASSIVKDGRYLSVLNKRYDGLPEGAVYIGRPSDWGNPFTIGKDGTRDQVIAKFIDFFYSSGLDARIHELRGKNLVCWCSPQRCHGHFLLARANRTPTEPDDRPRP